MTEQVKTVIVFYFLLPDLKSRGHPRYTMLISKNLDPDVILKVSEMDPEMEPVKFSGKIYRKNQVND